MSVVKMLAAAAAISVAVPATAAVTINFDSLPGGGTTSDGTAINAQYASLGVAFSGSATSGATGSPVATNYSDGPPVAGVHTGLFLSNVAAPGLLSQRYDTVTLSFANPVSGVSFGLNSFYTQGYVTFNAYNSLGALLQSAVLLQNGGWGLSTLSAINISRIDILSSHFANGSTAIWGIDNLTYTVNAVTPVPEPATWAMMIAGFGLAGGAMRRRKTRTAVTYA